LIGWPFFHSRIPFFMAATKKLRVESVTDPATQVCLLKINILYCTFFLFNYMLLFTHVFFPG
jgi:hypothetical protein